MSRVEHTGVFQAPDAPDELSIRTYTPPHKDAVPATEDKLHLIDTSKPFDQGRGITHAGGYDVVVHCSKL